MICTVICKNRVRVGLPDNVVRNVGEMVACPSSCSFRQRCLSNGINEFDVKFSQSFDGNAPQCTQYSPEEVARFFGDDDVITPEPEQAEENFNTAEQASSPIEDEPVVDPLREEQGDTSSPHSTSSKSNSWKGKRFGSRNETNNSPKNAPAVLKSESNYEYFEIGTDVFSDNPKLRTDRQNSLKRALSELFYYWEIPFVFSDSNNLRDEFVWLMTAVSTTDISVVDVQAIIENPNYDISQKFFYLFYDIVFKRTPPEGFYWSSVESTLSSITAHFKNKSEFIIKYCDDSKNGELFRSFFRERKTEIFHYLNVEDEEAFFDGVTSDIYKSKKKVVWVDRYNNYSPIQLGTFSTFVDDMQKPSDIKKMETMIKFLQKYRVFPEGVVLRDARRHPFQKSQRGILDEDESMYSCLGLNSALSATQYDDYVTLLREYVKEFNPERVKVGSLTFTKADYSKEIEHIVFELCARLFAEKNNEDDAYVEQSKAHAWLVKSLYEREILCTFACENHSYISQLMDLIKNPTPRKYFELSKQPKLIKGNSDKYTVGEYFKNEIEDKDILGINEILKEEVISEYLDVKIINKSKMKDFEANIEKLFTEYEKQYSNFCK